MGWITLGWNQKAKFAETVRQDCDHEGTCSTLSSFFVWVCSDYRGSCTFRSNKKQNSILTISDGGQYVSHQCIKQQIFRRRKLQYIRRRTFYVARVTVHVVTSDAWMRIWMVGSGVSPYLVVGAVVVVSDHYDWVRMVHQSHSAMYVTNWYISHSANQFHL
jgi:hypothetical protein